MGEYAPPSGAVLCRVKNFSSVVSMRRIALLLSILLMTAQFTFGGAWCSRAQASSANCCSTNCPASSPPADRSCCHLSDNASGFQCVAMNQAVMIEPAGRSIDQSLIFRFAVSFRSAHAAAASLDTGPDPLSLLCSRQI
ncbi:MAG: hypothetical protein IVW54_11685 [Candidatus Binataceae bacterium]|nr:hypothetical protein [Candidatus Binataceae bacterium]